jgi:YVTN family beta-propeller protein
MKFGKTFLIAVGASVMAACVSAPPVALAAAPAPVTIKTVPGMPPVVDPNNLYSETRPDKLSPAVAKHLSRVYVPNRKSNDVWVIDPETLKVVDKFKVGIHPQHVVPSWDLKTLWVNNNAEHRTDGSVTPIDPTTGKPGNSIPVDDLQHVFHARRQRRHHRRRSA